MPADTAVPAGAAARLAAPQSPLAEFWSSFTENRGAVFGMVILVLIALTAVFADFIAPYSPIEQFRDFTKLPPVWDDGGNWRFPLGTDALGRDTLSRLIHGARISLFIGLSVMVVSVVIGVCLGLVAAFAGGTVDSVIMRVMDLIIAVPSLVLCILVVAVLGPSLPNTIWAVTIVYLPRYVRLVRASALSEIGKDYVTAALRYESRDVLRDRATNEVVEGNDDPSEATELWTFVRERGTGWKLAAIQAAA